MSEIGRESPFRAKMVRSPVRPSVPAEYERGIERTARPLAKIRAPLSAIDPFNSSDSSSDDIYLFTSIGEESITPPATKEEKEEKGFFGKLGDIFLGAVSGIGKLFGGALNVPTSLLQSTAISLARSPEALFGAITALISGKSLKQTYAQMGLPGFTGDPKKDKEYEERLAQLEKMLAMAKAENETLYNAMYMKAQENLEKQKEAWGEKKGLPTWAWIAIGGGGAALLLTIAFVLFRHK
jgi:hypothetical protein